MADQGVTGELLQVSTIKFEWRIDDFRLLSDRCNDFYKSRVFNFMGSRWYLTLYPNGSECNRWVSLFLVRDDCGPPKTVNYTFEIVDYIAQSRSDTFKADGRTNGYKRFIERTDLELYMDFADVRSFRIRCYLNSVTPEKIPEQTHPMELTDLDALSGDLESLFARGVNCDVTINVQKKEFRAHRLIMAARSEVFAAMFAHDFSESKSGVVDVADCDSGSFGDFLRYMYTGKLEEVTQDNAIHLYRTADKYAVLKLKSFCVQYMRSNLSADSVCSVARLAHQHGEDELLASAQTFFNGNVAKVFSTKAWEELLRDDYLLGNRLLKEMASKMKIRA